MLCKSGFLLLTNGHAFTPEFNITYFLFLSGGRENKYPECMNFIDVMDKTQSCKKWSFVEGKFIFDAVDKLIFDLFLSSFTLTV